jgi:hypothetical protein
MLHRILVPLDGSGLAERALTYATTLGVRTGAEIVLLRVAYSHTMPGVDPRERQQGAIDDAQEYIDRLTTQVAAASGCTVQGVVRYGHPAECITESARTRQVEPDCDGDARPNRDRATWSSAVSRRSRCRDEPGAASCSAWQPLFGKPLADNPKIIVPLDGLRRESPGAGGRPGAGARWTPGVAVGAGRPGEIRRRRTTCRRCKRD